MSKIVFPENIGVTEYGTVRLGKDYIADGNDRTRRARIRFQTHAHRDHTSGWLKNIRPGRALVTSKPTIELLGLDYPNVHKNGNIVPLLHNQEIESKGLISSKFQMDWEIENSDISLFDANHMVGSSQVLVKNRATGITSLYSGDIGWPLEIIPNADVLILDSTYSKLETSDDKNWSRQDAVDRLLQLISSNLSVKPIYIYARFGIMQEIIVKILENIDSEINFVGSDEIISKTNIISTYLSSSPTKIINEKEKYNFNNVIHLKEFHKKQNESLNGLNITINNFNPQNNAPDRESSDGDYINVLLALTNHASGEDLANYIQSVNPKYIITDSARNASNANKLADQIMNKFKILSIPSSLSSVWKD